MKVNEKNILGIILLTIVLIIAFGSVSHIKAVAKESYFSNATDAAETQFRTEIKDVLKTYGAKNAGITMTKISEDGYSLEYRVVISLPDYINLENGKEESIMADLNGIVLDVSEASVEFSFS